MAGLEVGDDVLEGSLFESPIGDEAQVARAGGRARRLRLELAARRVQVDLLPAEMQRVAPLEGLGKATVASISWTVSTKWSSRSTWSN